jgi:hypothetical protein
MAHKTRVYLLDGEIREAGSQRLLASFKVEDGVIHATFAKDLRNITQIIFKNRQALVKYVIARLDQ